MIMSWHEDNRPKYDGHYALVDGKKFKTVIVDGVQRFRENRIVRDLMNAAREGDRLDLNTIAILAMRGAYSKEEMHEFYRLIGYSVCGFSEVFEDADVRSDLWEQLKRYTGGK